MAGRIGCFSMDLSLGIWESSETFDAIFGIDPDYPRDTGGWLGLLAPDAREAHRRQLLALSQDQERFDLAFRIVRRSDGQERWISGQGALECDVQGQATRLIGTMQDLTEHRQAEQDLQISEQRSRAAEARIRRMNEELEQRVAERTAQLETANQELEAFSYSVSHDLRAPLQVISGSSETLLAGAQDRLDPVGRQCLAMISRSTWRMGQLINDLLKLAQAGRAGLELADLDLSGLCRNILAESGQAGPELELVIEADLRVRADLSLLRAALENLLANAVKFSSRQAAPRIAVGAARTAAGERCYFVRDNGAGFDLDRAGKLFSPFQRFHSSEEFEGTGIGLAIVQRVIHRHGGRVWAEAAPDQGAAFFFTLPEAGAALASPEPPAPAPAPPGPGRTGVDLPGLERALLDSLLELLPDRIFCKDLNSRLISFSRSYARMFEPLEPAQLKGRTDFELFAEEHARAAFRDEQEIIRTGAARLDLEEKETWPDGRVTWCTTSKVPFRDAQGTLIGTLGISKDITGQKQAEAERAGLQAQLLQAHKLESLGTLTAGLAHNLNNVLAIALGTASLREQAATDPEDQEAYRSIRRICRHGRDVIRSLMHFAQPGLAGKAPMDLNESVREVRELLEHTGQDRIRIVEALAPEPLWLEGDAGSITQALANLFLNAQAAMPGGGTLTLRTGVPREGWVEAAVEDVGAGMTPEVLARAADPFYTTREVGQGAGLGLSMVHGVIQAHGGTLELTSQPGRGTQVRLRFPRIPTPAQDHPAPTPSPALGSLSVILVDDDEDVRFLMTRMLRKAGVQQVQAFSGGREALEHLRLEALPDLVILDQNMPFMNGAQTLERLRSLHPLLPVVISSGQPNLEARPEFQQPRVAVISKPFTVEEIQAKLARFMG